MKNFRWGMYYVILSIVLAYLAYISLGFTGIVLFFVAEFVIDMVGYIWKSTKDEEFAAYEDRQIPYIWLTFRSRH